MAETENEILEEIEDNNEEIFHPITKSTLESLLDQRKYDEFIRETGIVANGPSIDEIIQLHNLNEEAFFTNLFTFLSVLAGESMTSQTLTGTELLRNIKIQFDFWYENIFTKEKYREAIFTKLHWETWSTKFESFLQNKRNLVPNTTFKKNNASITDPEDLKSLFFAKTVSECFREAKTAINNHLNPLWIPPAKLPSGVSLTSWLTYLREKYFLDVRVHALAVSAVSGAFRRNNPGMSWKVDDHQHEIKEKEKTYQFKNTFYPACWISFILLGLPSSDPVASLSSGRATTIVENPENLQQLRQTMGKVNRRALQSCTSETPNKRPRSDSHSSPEKVFVIRHVHTNGDDETHRLQYNLQLQELKLKQQMFQETKRNETLKLLDERIQELGNDSSEEGKTMRERLKTKKNKLLDAYLQKEIDELESI